MISVPPGQDRLNGGWRQQGVELEGVHQVVDEISFQLLCMITSDF